MSKYLQGRKDVLRKPITTDILVFSVRQSMRKNCYGFRRNVLMQDMVGCHPSCPGRGAALFALLRRAGTHRCERETSIPGLRRTIRRAHAAPRPGKRKSI